jgi:hypothetical protein
MSSRLRIVLLGAAFVAVLVAGLQQLRAVRMRVVSGRARVAELENKLADLRIHAMALRAQPTAARFEPLPLADDPITNEILLRSHLQTVLARHGLEGVVQVGPKAHDGSFPSVMPVDVLPIDLGILDYASYGQIVAVLEDLRRLPLAAEALCYGCSEIPVPGKFRMRLRYYPEVN